MVAAIVFPMASGASSVIDEIKRALTPGEGDLIVNVNTATMEELITIPGIGEKLAHEIVRARPYETVEDLKRAKGIGDYTLNSIRPYVKVKGKTERR